MPFFRAGRKAYTEIRKSLSLRPVVPSFEVAELLQIVGSVSRHRDIEQANDCKFECGYASQCSQITKKCELPNQCKNRAAAKTVAEPAFMLAVLDLNPVLLPCAVPANAA